MSYDGFYLPGTGPDSFTATRATEGPWTTAAQHAGPPSALLARAVEQTPPSLRGPAQVARFTVEILGPVPVGELTVHAEVLRPGRSVELLGAWLEADGRTVMEARAWRIRTAALRLPVLAATAPPIPAALPQTATEFHEPAWRAGYLDAVEWRFVEGHFERPGPALVWSRLRVPLVAGEEPSPLQRLMAVADSGNGLSGVLDLRTWWFINTELTVHLHRPPTGEWICLRAHSTLDPSGAGLAETELFDLDGRVGRGAQALMIGPR